MDFGALPPEVNSGRMYAGPGSGPMVAAAAGWGELAPNCIRPRPPTLRWCPG